MVLPLSARRRAAQLEELVDDRRRELLTLRLELQQLRRLHKRSGPFVTQPPVPRPPAPLPRMPGGSLAQAAQGYPAPALWPTLGTTASAAQTVAKTKALVQETKAALALKKDRAVRSMLAPSVSKPANTSAMETWSHSC